PRRSSDLVHLGGDAFSYAIQRQVTDDIELIVTIGHNFLADKSGLREFLNIKEITTAQVFIALGVVTVDAGGINGDVDGAGFKVFGVVSEFAAEGIETAGEVAVTQMLDAEVDGGVGTGGIDNILI